MVVVVVMAFTIWPNAHQSIPSSDRYDMRTRVGVCVCMWRTNEWDISTERNKTITKNTLYVYQKCHSHCRRRSRAVTGRRKKKIYKEDENRFLTFTSVLRIHCAIGKGLLAKSTYGRQRIFGCFPKNREICKLCSLFWQRYKEGIVWEEKNGPEHQRTHR